jgi:hypothetical protein
MGGGGHFGGGGAHAGGHFASGHPGGAHFAGGPHFGRTGTQSYTNHYLTYTPGTRTHHLVARGSSQILFTGNSRFTGRFSPFGRRFGFSRRRFWSAGFWPWWGWDEGWWGDCDNYEWNCYDHGQDSAAGYPESREGSDYDEATEEARPMITVYLRDGTGYGALDYWLTNGVFNIETTYGSLKSFPMDQVDVRRTFTENTARGVTFTLSTSPLVSDPGPMFAPASYAPDCPSPSQASGAPASVSGPSPAASASSNASWFGAGGSSSVRGLAVASVRSNSPAALIGVQPGDIVLRVNCQQIRTAQDIESAVNNSSGPIWVSYMIQGAWLTDKKITR